MIYQTVAPSHRCGKRENEDGEDVVTHFLRCLFIFGPSLCYLLCSDLTGNANRWVTTTAGRERSDFGFEMHHGSLSLSTEENASSCCHSNGQNKCDTVGERAGELSSESHQRLRLNVVLCTSKAHTHTKRGRRRNGQLISGA